MGCSISLTHRVTLWNNWCILPESLLAWLHAQSHTQFSQGVQTEHMIGSIPLEVIRKAYRILVHICTNLDTYWYTCISIYCISFAYSLKHSLHLICIFSSYFNVTSADLWFSQSRNRSPHPTRNSTPTPPSHILHWSGTHFSVRLNTVAIYVQLVKCSFHLLCICRKDKYMYNK